MKITFFRILIPIIIFLFQITVIMTNTTTSFALKPDSTYVSNPDSLQAGIKWSDHMIKTRDQIDIAIRQLQPMQINDNSKYCIVLCGGDHGNLSYFTLQAAALSFAGYHIVTFDYRGFGRSSSLQLDEEFMYYDAFTTDLTTVIDWVKSQYPKSKVGILAFSMGTIVAQEYLSNHKLDFAVMEGLVINPVMVAKRIQDQKEGIVVKVPESGYDFERRTRKIKTPILLFAGDQDNVTSLADAERFRKKRKRNRYLKSYNGGHLMGMGVMTDKSFGDLYVGEITRFLLD